MKVKFEKSALLPVLQTVANAAAGNSTLPILANVLIKATDNHIQLAATNLEVGVKAEVAGEIVEAGSITVPAKKLLDIVRSLSDDEVTLSTTASDRVQIVSGKARFRVAGLLDDEFPTIPDSGEAAFSIDAEVFRKALQKTAFAVSKDETRHFLTGVYMGDSSDAMVLVSTDGRRLAIVTQDAAIPKIQAIIPLGAVNMVVRTFTGGELSISLVDNQMVFAGNGVILVSRLIEGDYPDYNTILEPLKNNEIEVTGDTATLIAAIRRVSLMAPSTPLIKLSVQSDKLVLSAATPETGDAQEEVAVKTTGMIEIAFNAKFLLDALSHIDDECVVMKFGDALSPGLICPAANGYVNVVMPMRG